MVINMKGGIMKAKNSILVLSMLLFMTGFALAAADGIHEPGTGLENPELMAAGSGQGNGSVNGSAIMNAGEGQMLRVQDGEMLGEGGQMMRIQTQDNERVRLEVGGKSAETSMQMNQVMENGQVKLSTQLSNGRNAEIKVMPDVASQKAMEQLKLQNCNEESNCSIELKEIGSGENAKAAYEVKTQRTARVLGLFKTQMQVKAQVDAENGEVVQVNKPWWAFLAAEPEE